MMGEQSWCFVAPGCRFSTKKKEKKEKQEKKKEEEKVKKKEKVEKKKKEEKKVKKKKKEKKKGEEEGGGESFSAVKHKKVLKNKEHRDDIIHFFSSLANPFFQLVPASHVVAMRVLSSWSGVRLPPPDRHVTS
uniref:Uncharacterized protein n=1 Tax=Knipowitschia caucasica TaxID=637954 RepID=A0AAV2J8W6_KNICA